MLFEISMWALIVIAVAWGAASLLFVAFGDMEDKLYGPVMALIFAVMAGAIPGLTFFGTWQNHANDIAKIQSQDEIIRVQKDRADRLNDRLSSFDYPSGALLSADTPVGSIVSELSSAEAALARAEAERATAIRSVEARRIGPFSGVIEFAGDYK